ncbi:MAG: NAD-dependent epimerase/dehydratase family protein [candidate division Zixibacteria bacterium]|nr:NAD-dependent epimerase/dehydratase family protein [candidate division Zixibacteria bacterium]
MGIYPEGPFYLFSPGLKPCTFHHTAVFSSNAKLTLVYRKTLLKEISKSLSSIKTKHNLPLKGKKCLVTGANGFVGSHLCECLVDSGAEVHAFIRKSSNTKSIKHLPLKYSFGELRDQNSLAAAVEGMDYIFHTGGLTKAKNKQDFFDINHGGTFKLVNAVLGRNPGLRKLIYISSQAAVGPGNSPEPVDENFPPNPVTTYGCSKLEGEREVKLFSERIPSVILRPPAVYGPRDTEVFSFFEIASRGIKPFFTGGDRYVSMVYVKDLVDGIIAAAAADNTNSKTYFLTDGKVYHWNEMINSLLASFGKKGWKVIIPTGMFVFFGAVSESFFRILNKTPMLTREKARELTCKYWACSSQRAMSDFGYSPEVDFREGARLTAKWYKDNGWL